MFNPFSWLGPLLQVIVALDDPTAPTVTLDNSIVTGKSSNNVDSFLGIPFARARRFYLPDPVKSYVGDIDATEYGAPCMQHDLVFTATPAMKTYMQNNNVNIPVPANQSEDCLSINIIRPASVTPQSKLPVVVWFFGGGFLIGDSETWDAMGTELVQKSVATSEDTIFVSFNYRLSAYGFLAGQEVQDAGIGNLGLRDQREALKWVQKYIAQFGGNPGRVILWGQSAGGISATFQMLAHNGDNEGLFHGVFSQSGAPLPVGSVLGGQDAFNSLATGVGCTGSEKLQCLREVPLETLKYAVNATDGVFSENALLLAWPPRADGEFLTDNPQKLVQEGNVANVPVVTGNVDDEGTLFSIGKTGSIKLDAGFKNWVNTVWMPNATAEEKLNVSIQYPNDPQDGSPFGTGNLHQYALNRQYKRIAAFQGDMVFQAPRRFFVQELVKAGRANVWVYLSKRFKLTPNLGAAHGSDVNTNLGIYLFTDYVIKFANHLDPNINDDVHVFWPPYNTARDVTGGKVYVLPRGDPAPPPVVQNDDQRELPFALLTDLGLKYPL